MSFDRTVLPPPASVADAPGATARSFASRAGLKLDAALGVFDVVPAGRVCADLGANVGGFTDCLLQYGAARVHAVDTAYGVLAWNLRKDPRVVVHDRTNALHARLGESVTLIAIDVGWTRQEKILPAAMAHLSPETGGDILTLVKPHYESDAARSQRGVLMPEQSEEVLWQVMERVAALQGPDGRGLTIGGVMRSPVEGQKGNVEYVAWLRRGAQG